MTTHLTLLSATACLLLTSGCASQTAATGGKGGAELTIKAIPWAKCTVNGEAVGTTPKTLSLPAGTHTITCSKMNDSRTKSVTVAAAETATVQFTFATTAPPPPRKTRAIPPERRLKGLGTVVIKAVPWAKCDVGSLKDQTTPARVGLPPGEVAVTCRRQGDVQTKKTQVRAGETVELVFEMK